MTIRYRNTFLDLVAGVLHCYSRSPTFLGLYGLIFILFSRTIVKSLPQDEPAPLRIAVFVIMELLLLLFIFGVFAVTGIASMISKMNKTVLTDHTITLADQSFITETAYARTEQKWAGVQKLAQTRNYVFIYMAQYSLHIVPRRAFRDDDEWDSFYEYCRQHTGVARPAVNQTPAAG